MDRQSFVVLGKWTTFCGNMGDGSNFTKVPNNEMFFNFNINNTAFLQFKPRNEKAH
jgi:hypothetical protein